MTDDVEALVADLKARSIECAPPSDQGWGVLTHVTLPSGSKLGVYQPKHPSPSYGETKSARAATKTAPRKTAPKKPAKKKIPAKAKKRR